MIKNGLYLIALCLLLCAYVHTKDVYPFNFPYKNKLKVTVENKNKYYIIKSYKIKLKSGEELNIASNEFINSQLYMTENGIKIAVKLLKKEMIGEIVEQKSGFDKKIGLRYYYIRSINQYMKSEAKLYFKNKGSLVVLHKNLRNAKSTFHVDSIYYNIK